MTFWAEAGSSQKPGAADCSLRSFRRARLDSTSKVLLDVSELRLDLVEPAAEVVHALSVPASAES
jgi:hypothetical protein